MLVVKVVIIAMSFHIPHESPKKAFYFLNISNVYVFYLNFQKTAFEN